MCVGLVAALSLWCTRHTDREPAAGSAPDPAPTATRAPVRLVMRVSGRLALPIIQRVVRERFPAFRQCYEAGLTRNASLAGLVTADFVITRDGSVSELKNGGSDLPDPGVVKCVLDVFRELRFPEPEEGIVMVVYPIYLQPGP